MTYLLSALIFGSMVACVFIGIYSQLRAKHYQRALEKIAARLPSDDRYNALNSCIWMQNVANKALED